MHLGKLQLRLRTDSLREGSVSGEVSKSLPLWLVLLEDLPLRVVSDDLATDESA